MILGFHGLTVTQPQIVTRLFGGAIDLTADEPQILAALTGFAMIDGRVVRIDSTARQPGSNDLIADLANEQPMLVGLHELASPIGHAYVLTAATFSVGLYGDVICHSVLLHNPSPFSPDSQVLSWAEFISRLRLIVRVRVQPV
jgi:hypothetical protein